MAEATLIWEPSGYSAKALAIYSSAGAVLKNGEQHFDPNKITTLVIRLGQHLTGDFLAQFPNLRRVVSPTTGLTHVDLEACRARKIEVFSLKSEQAFLGRITSTSELTLGLMLALLRRIPEANRAVLERNEWNRETFKSRQCSNLTLGLIGFGRIGRHMARFGAALGMRVLAHDPFLSSEVWAAQHFTGSPLALTLGESDIVSIHADDRRSNWGMVNERFIKQMKPGALLINTSRGELLDEAAVVEALSIRSLGGVAVDVLASEHTGEHLKTSPLLQAARAGANIIVTPHVGGCTADAMWLTEEHMAQRWLERVKASA